MGEDIFNFILKDISGIPALPVFIGNYLLDLLGSFFPILVLLASFVMLYTGLTRSGGDWKSTAQSVAPTAISLAVIMGLLAMKTPYTSSDSGKLGGGIFQDTNSYTVVEMMNTFLGFGNIFADALTQKIIYGSIEVTNGDNNFNGYFPSVLQALIDKDRERVGETKKFLTTVADRSDILTKIKDNNQTTTMQLNSLINQLHFLGIIEDYRKVTLTDILNIKTRNFITSNEDKIQLAYYKRPLQENSLNEKYEVKDGVNVLKRPESRFIEMEANTFLKKSVNTDSDNGLQTLNLDKGLGSYGSSSSAYGISFDKTFSYLYVNNFDNELAIINTTKSMIKNYLLVYKEYQNQIDKLTNEIDSAKTKEDKVILEKAKQDFVMQKEKISGQIATGGGLLKDLLFTIRTLADLDITGVDVNSLYDKAFDGGFSSSIDSSMGIDKFFDNIPEKQFLTDDHLKMIKDGYLSIRPNIDNNIYKVNDELEYRINKNAEKLAGQLNQRMRMKAFITIIFYDRLQEFVKDDALFQAALDFNSTAPFNKLFLSENDYQAMTQMENKKNALKEEFKDETNVANKLKEEIQKQYSTNDLGQGNIIHWTDLGKYYGTFKNLYSPMISNIYLMSKTNEVDDAKTLQLAQFIQNLEPNAKAERLLNGATAIGGLQIGMGVVKGALNFGSDGGKKGAINAGKDILGGFWDAVQTIGGTYLAILFINVVLPAFIWMFVIISYYIEMSIYVAVFPLGFMFMIFQSYRQSIHQYINMLLGFILMPVILVSMYFIVLYIDMLLPMFFKQFMPFFGNYSELSNAFSVSLGQSSSSSSTILGSMFGVASQVLPESSNVIGMIGNVIYTLLSMLMSSILLMTFFRAHEYMSKILNVSTVGIDAMNSQSTLQKFTSFDRTGLTKSLT